MQSYIFMVNMNEKLCLNKFIRNRYSKVRDKCVYMYYALHAGYKKVSLRPNLSANSPQNRDPTRIPAKTTPMLLILTF